ncbi:TPA: hypothetical protein GF185_24360 [Escherichia coli]|nr:hypothetical protein [Escherichia coli]
MRRFHGFSEPFRFTGFSTGRWAVHTINNKYPQNQMSDCLNRCIWGQFGDRKFLYIKRII